LGDLARRRGSALNDASGFAPHFPENNMLATILRVSPWIALAVVVLAITANGPAAAQPAGDGAAAKAVAKIPLIPRKLLFGNPDKAGAKVSPDGKHISYLAPVDGVLNVW
jgi:hypothetical protein